MMLQRSTLQLLRFHFSLFLLPVFLFALSQLPVINWLHAAAAFVILHLLVYPSSNGYNSYMDKDETPIGGLAHPLMPTKQLFYVSVLMDVIAILFSLFISRLFALGILLYILASRAYSYRGIRLKKFPILGFLTVFIFQGGVVFFCTYSAVNVLPDVAIPMLPCFIASLLIGASYPLTQIYQHEQDKADGVTTLSYQLGKRGTFVFSGLLFLTATVLMYGLFKSQRQPNFFFIFLLFMFPVVAYFLVWMMRVWKNETAANFKHSLWMNLLSTVCLTGFFITLIIRNHFE